MKLQGQGLNYKGKNHVKLSLTHEGFNKLKFSEGLTQIKFGELKSYCKLH